MAQNSQAPSMEVQELLAKYTPEYLLFEMVLSKTGEKSQQQLANRFYKATLNYVKELRQGVKQMTETMGEQVTQFQNMSEGAKRFVVDRAIRYTVTTPKGKKRVVCYLNANGLDMLSTEVSLEADEIKAVLGVNAPVQSLSDLPAEQAQKLQNYLLEKQAAAKWEVSHEIKNYFTELQLPMPSKQEVNFCNAVRFAYNKMADAMGSAMVLRMTGLRNQMLIADAPAMGNRNVWDFLKEPDKKWYVLRGASTATYTYPEALSEKCTVSTLTALKPELFTTEIARMLVENRALGVKVAAPILSGNGIARLMEQMSVMAEIDHTLKEAYGIEGDLQTNDCISANVQQMKGILFYSDDYELLHLVLPEHGFPASGMQALVYA